MVRKILALIVLLPLLSCASGVKEAKNMPSGRYKLDKAHSSVHFKVNHMGLSYYTARFTDFSANLDFNAKEPEESGLSVIVKAESIKTDFPFIKRKDFDKFLSQNENWFNSKKFPDIKFKATKISWFGGRTATMKGNLTMLGVTKPVKFKVKFNGSHKKKPFSGVPALGFSASAKIKRSEWGFGAFIPSIGDEVEIIIETEFHKS